MIHLMDLAGVAVFAITGAPLEKRRSAGVPGFRCPQESP